MLLVGYIFYILVSKYEEKWLTWIIKKTLGIKTQKYFNNVKLKIIIIITIIIKWLNIKI